jgi:hypothetical protein
MNQVRWIQGRVDSENITRSSHQSNRCVATMNAKIICISCNPMREIFGELCVMEVIVIAIQLQKVDKDQKPPGGIQRNDNSE